MPYHRRTVDGSVEAKKTLCFSFAPGICLSLFYVFFITAVEGLSVSLHKTGQCAVGIRTKVSYIFAGMGFGKGQPILSGKNN